MIPSLFGSANLAKRIADFPSSWHVLLVPVIGAGNSLNEISPIVFVPPFAITIGSFYTVFTPWNAKEPLNRPQSVHVVGIVLR